MSARAFAARADRASSEQKALVLGATGFVGNTVARHLISEGYKVAGLARTAESAGKMAAQGIDPLSGDLRDPSGVAELAKAHDIIIAAAMLPPAQEAEAMAALIEHLKDGRHQLIMTSGTGVLSSTSRDGRWGDHVYAEDDVIPPRPREGQAIRLTTEGLVRRAGHDGFKTTVVRPPLIFGHGGSHHIPLFFQTARSRGAAYYLGKGLNTFSNVHVDDLAKVYSLALRSGKPGALYHAVGGEADFRRIAEAVGTAVGCNAASIDYNDACALWGADVVNRIIAVNSRSSARRTRDELGWHPRGIDLVEEILSGAY